LTAVDNTKDGNTVLPVIKNGGTLTILTVNGSTNPGYGDIIDASGYGRLFDVVKGGSLTLENVTLQNGRVQGSGVSAEGGAIYNQGTLVLSEVLIQNNTAAGLFVNAAGGGIWSNRALTLENSTLIQANSATGGDGGTTGGNAFGGGIYIAGGTANITDTTFGQGDQGNKAQGGFGAHVGGSAYGGAVYVAAGTVTMSADTLGLSNPYNYYANTAEGGVGGIYDGNSYGGALYVAGGSVTLTNDYVQVNRAGRLYGSYGYGGGIFIASGATVYLDAFTVANTGDNLVSLGSSWSPTDNIDGTYILLP
jgi:hypothetical protein